MIGIIVNINQQGRSAFRVEYSGNVKAQESLA